MSDHDMSTYLIDERISLLQEVLKNTLDVLSEHNRDEFKAIKLELDQVDEKIQRLYLAY